MKRAPPFNAIVGMAMWYLKKSRLCFTGHLETWEIQPIMEKDAVLSCKLDCHARVP